jgi:ribonuclease P protein component
VGHGQGEAHISAEHPSAGEGPRFSDSHEHEERSPGAEAPAGKGSQAADREQHVADSRSVASTGKGPAAFGAHERVRRRSDYERIYSRGVKISGKCLTLFMLVNDLKVGRLGIAATKKIGGAATRNRAKRLIREVFRQNKLAPGFDLVVIPKRELVDASLAAIEAEFRNTIGRARRRLRP